jgi:hypothetical protein
VVKRKAWKLFGVCHTYRISGDTQSGSPDIIILLNSRVTIPFLWCTALDLQ